MSSSSSPSVLLVGGTGTISTACARRAVAQGFSVTVLNRGNNPRSRTLPDEVTQVGADVHDSTEVEQALGSRRFDAIVNFVAFTEEHSREAIALFRERTGQYVHISTASMYHKPVQQIPYRESTPRHNPFVRYSREKITAEDVLMDAYETGFPVTIVRPSHTYDEARPPVPGDWTVIDRILRGADIVVPGDGTSLWTLTHADDFAIGLVGLLANPRAVGESFHITSDDVYTWDQMYRILGDAAGKEVNLVHVPSEFYGLVAPDWPWSELIHGDLSHSALFDNSKIRSYVPLYEPRRTFHGSARSFFQWREGHVETTRPDPAVDQIYDRLAEGYHRSRQVFESLTLAPDRR